MKILIVDDIDDELIPMAELARRAGHEVLAIFVNYGYTPIEGLTRESDREKVVSLAKSFNPDLTFLDHSIGKMVGSYFARVFEFPREKLIGTSTVDEQEYCGGHFWGKDTLNNPDVQKEFLAHIK